MKIKLDENIPSAVVTVLRSRGLDTDTVLEESLGGHDDRSVLNAATAAGRLLITLDRGFGDLHTYPPGSHSGIIVLRPEDQRVSTVLGMIESLLDHHQIDELAGCITVVQRNMLRVRRPGQR